MSFAYFVNPIIFLISVVFELYLLVVMLRVILQWIRADFYYNPICQFIVKITNPLVIPFRKVIPGIAGIDLASIVLLLVTAMLKLLIIDLLSGFGLTAPMLIARSVADILALFLNIYFFTILIQVILSWIAPHQHNHVTVLIHQLNEPLLQPIRRFLPTTSGFDFSPLVAIILIQLSKMILIPPLMHIY